MKTADFEKMKNIEASGAWGAATYRHKTIPECQWECVLSKHGCIGFAALLRVSGYGCSYHYNWENFEGNNISFAFETDLYIRRTCQGNVSILSEA